MCRRVPFVYLKMPSLLPGYEYDIFLSYRQKDNRGDKWVTEFVRALKTELDATFKEDISIYFDENPDDGLLETHHVDKSLEGKLKCLVFIPILSQTYCDPKSFAWQQEFCAFNKLALDDSFGRDIPLANGNVASRILPVKIHELDSRDRDLIEKETGSVLRAVDFIYKEPGVNRPLKSSDSRAENLNKTDYRNQVNKVANAIREIVLAITEAGSGKSEGGDPSMPRKIYTRTVWQRVRDRGLIRVGLVYAAFGMVGYRLVLEIAQRANLGQFSVDLLLLLLALGFPFSLWMAWRFELSPAGFVRTSSDAASSNPYSATQKRPLTGNITLAILLVLIVVQVALYAPAKRTADDAKSIAVLYFDNISNDPEQEPFADGITEEITAHLSRIRDLRVTSRTSVLPYKGKANAVNIRQMAGELGVDNILEGSVRKSGNKLRITAQLIEARSDKHLWTEVYDREVTDVFSIQSEIAKAIAGKFNLVLTSEANAQINQVPTRNMEAYELFRRAKALPGISGFGIGTYTGSTEKGIRLLKEAIRLDDDFADAYFLLGNLYFALHQLDSAILTVKEGIIRNPRAAIGFDALAYYTGQLKWLKKAYALDTASGLVSYGDAFRDQGELSTAVRCYQEAARRMPNNVSPVVRIASLYVLMSAEDSVQKYQSLARRLDPLSSETLEAEVFTKRFRVAPEEWKETSRKYYGDDSISYYKDLGVVYLFAKQWKDAEAAYAKTNYRDMDLGLVMLKTGREDSARTIFKRSLDYHLTHSGGWDGNLARIYAVVGNREKALEYYKKVLLPYGYISFFRIDPFTDYIREDPAYKKLEAEAATNITNQIQQIKDDIGKPLNLEGRLARLE